MISDRILKKQQTIFDSWLSILRQEKAIAVIRSPRFDLGLAMAEAVAKGGIRLIEITWNSEQPQELIAELRVRFPHCLIGAGTVLNSTQLQNAIACGAQFIFSPHFNRDLVEISIHRNQIPYVPGVLTPTEIVTAYSTGASALKVFPISTMGGASYLKSLQAPLGDIPLIPTGGVTIDNAAEMITAGAIAVGLSGSLFPASLVTTGNWQQISDRSQQLLSKLNQI
ncbi:Entner-Doudoroff aldolase [Hyella patelloides LEGE 07179]|uniref:Entner-Doudoroff aldolase n=1 Tax=Hyella patelloides LEGE 07179 TaxID=945734 RepID=A0A563VJ74_9CYAN|nr:bifunctional 4-hydroxy-2-oxoglutarate aldolase/2-dehydro-3-deoxy-phosphogluconate aldolase [Hyella patelloides]VEP11441.1 Entner-Doudoroff aldolase [Hyella patelloides LEGE 07179]